MAAPLSTDLRVRIVEAYNGGMGSYESIARSMRVGSATVKRLVRLHRATGSVDPRPHRCGPLPVIKANHYEQLRRLLDAEPDLTYDELARRWSRVIGFDVSRSAAVKGVKRLGYTRKKRLSSQRSATAQTSRPSAKPSSGGRSASPKDA